MKKFLAAVAAAAVAATAITTSAFAYDLNKDLGKGWSASVTVGPEEFADLTADTTVTITFTTDDSLVGVDGQEYWCLKPLFNSPSGWSFIEGIDLPLSEAADTYTAELGDTSMVFNFPADAIEEIKTEGIAFMGHGLMLETMTFSDEPIAAEETVADEVVEETVADEVTEEVTADAAEETPAADDKANPGTGVEGVGVVAALALAATAGVVVARKRK